MDENEEKMKSVLYEFTNRVNGNEKVQKLIRRWSTSVLMWSQDHGFGFVLTITTGKVVEVKKAVSEDEGNVKVVSSTATLLDMLSGKENIAHLYMDGVVETYGSEKDQIVLDAVARLLWS
ncbi:MAG: hypothetical protein M0Z77_06795 [Thermoplasmatales archaeon]|jgi:hypothetical protein|nr:hypothetical protein [Candidatus Thermoplasmatota archaeon]MDA8055340.1 hypothetical protein [Thermoplasmatales archaeon]